MASMSSKRGNEKRIQFFQLVREFFYILDGEKKDYMEDVSIILVGKESGKRPT